VIAAYRLRRLTRLVQDSPYQTFGMGV